MDIQLYATKVNIEPNGNQVTAWLEGVDLTELIAEIGSQQLLEALTNNDQFSDIVDYVTNVKAEDNE